MIKIIEIVFLILGFLILAFGILLVSCLFFITELDITQIAVVIAISGFFILVGILGIWASILYLRS